jgi:hypothetical protein
MPELVMGAKRITSGDACGAGAVIESAQPPIPLIDVQ